MAIFPLLSQHQFVYLFRRSSFATHILSFQISFKIILNMAFLLSHGAEPSMGNIFWVSHILQHISNKQVEVKSASTNLTWFYFYLHISILQFVFQHVLCSFVLFSNVLFQTFHYFWKHVLAKPLIHSADTSYIKCRLCNLFTEMDFVAKILLIETL